MSAKAINVKKKEKLLKTVRKPGKQLLNTTVEITRTFTS